MKRIVICFDGTWNTPADESLPEDQQVETNVRRFYESVHETGVDGIEQVKWYDQGVGTHWFDRFAGGTTAGLDLNILEGYKVLAEPMKMPTRFMCSVSVEARIPPEPCRHDSKLRVDQEKTSRVSERNGVRDLSYQGRRRDSATARLFRSMLLERDQHQVPWCIGYSRSAGSPVGVPESVQHALLRVPRHRVSGIVEHAYQAMAIDENRKDYDVCYGPFGETQSNNRATLVHWRPLRCRRRLSRSEIFRHSAQMDSRSSQRPGACLNPPRPAGE